MTEAEAVEALNAIDTEDDEELAHIKADSILQSQVSLPVLRAYCAVMERAEWWAFA